MKRACGAGRLGAVSHLRRAREVFDLELDAIKAVRAPGDGCLQCVGVQVVDEGGQFLDSRRGLRTASHGLSPGLLGQPVLVVGFSPAREVVFVEAGDGAELMDDVGIGEAVEEHGVDLAADVFGQAGDFAGAPAVEDESGGSAEIVDTAHFIRELAGVGLKRL